MGKSCVVSFSTFIRLIPSLTHQKFISFLLHWCDQQWYVVLASVPMSNRGAQVLTLRFLLTILASVGGRHTIKSLEEVGE
jgi:hypothetical protein